MLIKIDGVENKDFGKDKIAFHKFLKENTHSGKVSPLVEIFNKCSLSTKTEADKEMYHWIMSTFDTDRDFEKVDQNGWDLSNYKMNPVILWSHDYKIPAIGHCENIGVNPELCGDIIFNDKDYDEFGWSIGQRVKAGVLRSGSVGFRVDELEFLENKDRDCDLIYRKQELLEFSICCVPANPFALTTPKKELKIERVIQTDNSSFFKNICDGLARA